MTTHLNPARTPSQGGSRQDPHRSLHSETGGLRGEHPGGSKNPLVKVAGLAWLEFEKPDLDRAERFGTDFGFTVADRTPDTLLLRGLAGGRRVPGGPPRWRPGAGCRACPGTSRPRPAAGLRSRLTRPLSPITPRPFPSTR